MKKHFLLLAALFSITTAPIYSAAQQPAVSKAQQPVFSVNAQAERLQNLDTLKKQLEQYHDCTCKCGCYTHDIEMCIRDSFVSTHSRRMGKTIESIPEETMQALVRWRWPGNIRELENFLERAVILSLIHI